MSEYRFYCVTVTRRRRGGDFIDAESDDRAIAEVRRRNPDSDCEIWHGDRLVATVERHEQRA